MAIPSRSAAARALKPSMFFGSGTHTSPWHAPSGLITHPVPALNCSAVRSRVSVITGFDTTAAWLVLLLRSRFVHRAATFRLRSSLLWLERFIPGYTFPVKTAVSIPDDVFNAAEELARRTNVSRSELYANALRALIAKDCGVTESLDQVYRDVPSDPAVANAARRTISRSEW